MNIRTLILPQLLLLSFAVNAQTIIISPLTQAPTVDGENSEWRDVPAHSIQLRPIRADLDLKARKLTLKSGYYGDRVYFYAEWPDDHANTIHKPYIWDENKGRYKQSKKDFEDRFAMQFEMSGEYSTDWANATDFVADMWHWKAARSNPNGLAHDKYTVLSTHKLLRAGVVPSADGSKRYVLRPGDAGTPLYKILRYGRKQLDVMPKYKLLDTAEGSIADIKAKGIWREGRWHLELSRQLNTGHDDDAQFTLKQAVRGGIAVFDAGTNDSHLFSETLLFQF